MSENIHSSGSGLAELAGEIVSAYVAKNSVPVAELPKLIESVHGALVNLHLGTSAPTPDTDVDKSSSTEIRKSVRSDGIVSFIDGKSYKTLKRHLTGYGLDPRSYRDRYGLPANYPMVAPSYAEKRSALAKAIGLGRPGGMAERGRKHG
ncbi:MucR family transcriptional regulator [Methylobacterium sp. SI9]|uniref:MucR family transcriptional regulator n=1 Tax=Methylobacterium guangdongense TaxID=3138811 RepID=UPI00313DED7D